MIPILRPASVPIAAVLVACSIGLSPMIDYATLKSARKAEFFAYADTLAVRFTNSTGTTLVFDDPKLEDDRVVLLAGIASTGAARRSMRCFNLSRWSLPPGWEERVYWRNSDGSTVHVDKIDRSDAARLVVASCH